MAEHIGDRVRAVRKRRALTQMELASEAGLSVDTVSKVENGLHEPRPPTIRKLAGALRVEVEALTVGEE
jgi:transcriptional regulator with XRE-family HTH domain